MKTGNGARKKDGEKTHKSDLSDVFFVGVCLGWFLSLPYFFSTFSHLRPQDATVTFMLPAKRGMRRRMMMMSETKLYLVVPTFVIGME